MTGAVALTAPADRNRGTAWAADADTVVVPDAGEDSYRLR
jgi:hypothetical protein